MNKRDGKVQRYPHTNLFRFLFWWDSRISVLPEFPRGRCQRSKKNFHLFVSLAVPFSIQYCGKFISVVRVV